MTLEYGSSLPDTLRRPGDVPVYGSNGQVGFHNMSICPGPGIIIGRKGSVGQVCWSKEDFWPIDTTYYARPKKDLEPRWLYWLLLHSGLTKLNSSTGVPGLNRNDAYLVPVNCPRLNEQRAIAAILDTVQEAIRRTEALIAKLRQVKAGMLHDLLTRGLDENGELRDPIRHPEQFKDSALGRIPKEWEVKHLQSVCEKIGDGVHTSVSVESYGIPFLYVSCIRNGRILWNNCAFISESTFALVNRNKRIEIGTVLYTVVGSYGHAAMVNEKIKFSFQRHIAYLLPAKELSPQFLTLWLNSPLARNRADKLALGNAQKTITLALLSNMVLPLPSIESQKEIISSIGNVENEIEKTENELSKLHTLKQGLMQDLLTGRVRFPEALLQKYQTEDAAE